MKSYTYTLTEAKLVEHRVNSPEVFRGVSGYAKTLPSDSSSSGGTKIGPSPVAVRDAFRLMVEVSGRRFLFNGSVSGLPLHLPLSPGSTIKAWFPDLEPGTPLDPSVSFITFITSDE